MIINGKEEDVATPITVAELVEQRGLRADRVAVELNGEIVPRGRKAFHGDGKVSLNHTARRSRQGKI